MNTLVVLAAALVLNGTVGQPQGNYCLRLVRHVVEPAYGWPDNHFYELFWTHKVEENTTSEPWARDLERSMRANGYAVLVARGGDLVFNHRVAWPYGHAGVMLSDILVLDVWIDSRGSRLRVTPVWEWAPTTIVRLPESPDNR